MAKTGGNGLSLLPPGSTVQDIPHDLHVAIEHAYRILNWQENLEESEMPQPWMWHLEWELEAHFETVAAERKLRYGGGTSSVDDEPEEPIGGYDENVYASRFK